MTNIYLYLRIIIACLLLTFFSSFKLIGQKYLIETELITPDDGLANLYSSSIIKDKDGFLWIATQNGINKYEGYSFDLYIKENTGLAQNNNIGQIKEVDNNFLWVYYEGRGGLIYNQVEAIKNIDIFNRYTKEVIPFDVFFKNKAPFKATDIYLSEVKDFQKRHWVTTIDKALYLYQNGKFEKIYQDPNFYFYEIIIDEYDNIWLVIKQMLRQINKNGEILQEINLSKPILEIWLGTNNTLWITTFERIVLNNKTKWEQKIWYKEGAQPLTPFHLKKDQNKLIIQSSELFSLRNNQGYWYVSFENKINVFDPKGKWIYKLDKIENQHLTIEVIDVYQGDNFIWFATPKGLIKIKIQINPFQIVHKKEDFSSVRGIVEDTVGNIYFSNKTIYNWIPDRKVLSQITKKIVL